MFNSFLHIDRWLHSMFQCNLHDWLFVWLQAEKEIKGFIFFPSVRVVIELVTFHSLHFCHLIEWTISPTIHFHLWLEIHKSNSDQQTLWVSISNIIAIEWYCTETFLIMVPVDVINILHWGCGGVKFFPLSMKHLLCL